MMPFCLSPGTPSHMTKMLVELLFCPLTFCGASSGSERISQKQVNFAMIFTRLSYMIFTKTSKRTVS